MSYEVRVSEGATRELAKLPIKVQRPTWEHIQALGDDPRPRNAKPLTDPFRGIWRLKVREYRVSYTIDDQAQVVYVWRVGHRSTFYKRLQR